MTISRSKRALYFWPLLILVFQLLISAISFYGQYKLQTDFATRTEANERLEAKVHDMNCSQINKEAVLEVMKGLIADEKRLADVLFAIGVCSALTAAFAFRSFVVFRKYYAVTYV